MLGPRDNICHPERREGLHAGQRSRPLTGNLLMEILVLHRKDERVFPSRVIVSLKVEQAISDVER